MSKQPEKFQTITAYIGIKDADKAVEFYKDVFDAHEDSRFTRPDGKIGHGQITIGNSVLMITEANDMTPAPKKGDARPVALYVMLDDVDAVCKKAKAKNANIDMEPMDMFYGHRVGAFTDPFGHAWTVATLVEQLSDEEQQRRMDKMYAEHAKK